MTKLFVLTDCSFFSFPFFVESADLMSEYACTMLRWKCSKFVCRLFSKPYKITFCNPLQKHSNKYRLIKGHFLFKKTEKKIYNFSAFKNRKKVLRFNLIFAKFLKKSKEQIIWQCNESRISFYFMSFVLFFSGIFLTQVRESIDSKQNAKVPIASWVRGFARNDPLAIT